MNTWARGTVRCYWSAGALFWQLSIDHNIDVQLVFPWAPKLARKCESRRWFPCGADGRSYGHVITKFSRMGRLPHFLTYGALPTLARFARGWSSANIFIVCFCVTVSAQISKCYLRTTLFVFVYLQLSIQIKLKLKLKAAQVQRQ